MCEVQLFLGWEGVGIPQDGMNLATTIGLESYYWVWQTCLAAGPQSLLM